MWIARIGMIEMRNRRKRARPMRQRPSHETALNATAPTFQPKEPTMTKLRIVLALLVALVLPVAAEAVSDGCLPTPPTTPVPPVVAENVSWGFGSPADRLRFEIWRQPCLDGSGVALLLRASPLSPGPGYFCDDNLAVLQGEPSVRYCPGEGPAERVRLLQWSLHTEDVSCPGGAIRRCPVR